MKKVEADLGLAPSKTWVAATRLDGFAMSAKKEIRTSKFEPRNNDQNQNFQPSQTPISGITPSFRFSGFGFVSDFDIRASSFQIGCGTWS